jgi:hypothetical protein
VQLLAHRLLRLAGQSLWRRDKINRRVFARFRRRNRIDAQVVYVVVSDERHARKFRSLLQQFNCPYVVHIMDIYHEHGLDPETMTGFCSLFRDSSSNLALTDPIRNEIAKFDPRPVKVVHVGQEINPYKAQPPEKRKPLNIIMIGRPYHRGMTLLDKTWPRLCARFGSLELVYVGAHANALPPSVKAYVTDHGYLTDQDHLKRALAGAHLAYLSGPSELDRFGKFSFPSRCSDYLMAGLPILACVPKGSATEQFLRPLSPDCVCFVQSENDIIRSIESFTATAEHWRQGSERARAYAEKHLNIETIRQQVLSELRAAVRHGREANSASQ